MRNPNNLNTLLLGIALVGLGCSSSRSVRECCADVWADTVAVHTDSIAADTIREVEVEVARTDSIERVESEWAAVDLDSLHRLGTQLYREDLLEDAFPVWSMILSRADGRKDLRAEAHYVLGSVYFRRADYGRAEAEMQLAVKADSLLVDAYQDLGLLQFIKGHYDRAETYFAKVLRYLPSDSEATYWMGYTRATRSYERGLDAFSNDRYDEALRELRIAWQFLASDTSMNYQIQFVLGKTYLAKLDYDQALIHLDQCLALRPGSAEAMTEKAAIYFARVDFPKAIAWSRRAIAANPEFAKAYNNLGYIQFTMANQAALNGTRAKADELYQEALTLFERALVLDPAMQSAHLNRIHVGKILSGERNLSAYTMLQEARTTSDNGKKIRQYRAILEKDSTYDDAHNNLGVAYFVEGHADSAVAALERALAINPNNVQAHNNLGHILGTMHRYDEALKHVFIAIETKRDYLDAYCNLGYLYMWKEDFVSARKVWTHLLKIDPQNRLLRKGFAELERREEMISLGETTTRVVFESDSTQVEEGP